MDKQTVVFAVEVKDGVIRRIGKSYVFVPEIKFRGGGVKWFPDRHKAAQGKQEGME